MNRTLITIGLLLIGVVVTIRAQSGRQPGSSPKSKPAQQQDRRDDVLITDSDLVVLDARVLSKQTGRFVGNLKRQDFEIYEDGRKQEITHFSEDTPPLSIVFLIDMTTSATRDVFNKLAANLEQVLQHLRPEDQAAVMLVGLEEVPPSHKISDYSNIWLAHSFTQDKKLLANNITASALLLKPPEAPPILTRVATKHQAIYQAELQLEQVSPLTNRRVIMTLTDDLPWWTRRRFRNSNIFSGNGKETIAKKDLSRRLFTAGTMFCAFVTPDTTWTPRVRSAMKDLDSHPFAKLIGFGKGYNSFEYADMGYYAEPTGGEIVLATEENATTQLGEMIDHLYIRYSFGYVSSNRKRDGKFRKLELKVSGEVESREGGVKVATKIGYYPPKENKAKTDKKK